MKVLFFKDYEKYLPEMTRIWEEPGNDQLTMRELYDMAKDVAANSQGAAPSI